MHVGDDPGNDVEAAGSSGMTAVWMNRKNRAWPDRLARPDHEVADFHDLLNLLGL